MRWNYYPRNKRADETSKAVINAFLEVENSISTTKNKLKSNNVLSIVRPELEKIDFIVERGGKNPVKIEVPVLFGENSKVEKYFKADAYLERENYVIEVEAGRGYSNHQFLKDFFEACTMTDVKYLCIAVEEEYKYMSEGKVKIQKDFEKICAFFDSLYTSGRLGIPLEGLLIIGY